MICVDGLQLEHIPEDPANHAEAYPCECGGNIVRPGDSETFGCDNCEFKYTLGEQKFANSIGTFRYRNQPKESKCNSGTSRH